MSLPLAGFSFTVSVYMKPEVIRLKGGRFLESAVLRSAEVIKSGGIVIHPTDTCYGIAVDVTNQEAIRNVSFLKKRDNILFNMIVKDFSQWREYGKLYPIVRKIVEKYNDSQFSFVVPRIKKALPFFRPGVPTLSIQIPKLKFSQDLLEKTNVPLMATSANLAGSEVCYTIKDLLNQFSKRPDFPFRVLILDNGKLSGQKPSTVVEIIKGKELKILREGDVGRIEL